MKKPSSSLPAARASAGRPVRPSVARELQTARRRSGQAPDRAERRGRAGHDGGDGDEVWALLTEFALSMRHWWISTCYSLDLTPVQGMALRTLDPDSPVGMSALAETLECDASNITGVVDKMEARGLIARQGAENDRRVKVLVVTEKGRQVRRELLARASKAPAEIARMTKETRAMLATGLRAFLARAS